MGIWTIALFEMLKLARNKVFLLICFALPLLFIFTLGSALKGSFEIRDNEIARVKVAIFTEDGGELSGSLAQYLASPEVKKLILPIKVNSKADIMGSIKQGRANFGVYIPSGFSGTSGKKEWVLYSGFGLSKNITAQTVFGTFAQIVDQGQEEASLGEAEMQRETSHISVEKPKNFTALQYYSVHMLLMFVLYSGMMGAVNLFLEEKDKTLARLYSVPIAPGNILAGKLVGFGMIGFLQSLIIIFVSKSFFQVDWGTSFFRILMAILLIVFASLGISLLTASFSKDLNGFIALTNAVILFLTFLAGGFYPGMGGLIESASFFAPNYWAASILLNDMVNLTNGNAAARELWTLAGMSFALFVSGFVIFKKGKMRAVK